MKLRNVVLGGLAYTEWSSGNDNYDEYEALFDQGDYDAADEKYDETIQQDDKAKLLGVLGGTCAGLFLLQQFVLGGSQAEDSAESHILSSPALTYDPTRQSVRLELLRLSN